MDLRAAEAEGCSGNEECDRRPSGMPAGGRSPGGIRRRMVAIMSQTIAMITPNEPTVLSMMNITIAPVIAPLGGCVVCS